MSRASAATLSRAPGLPDCRLRNQCITEPRSGGPADLVGWLGAVQAQEYPFAKWGLALRLRDQGTNAEIERAFADGRILRTHVLRPTWHFVTADDIGWMLELTAPRIQRTLASYVRRQGPDNRTLVRATSIIERSLAGSRHLTRAELRTQLSKAGLALAPLQLGFVTMYAELERVICSGPRRGKQFTYALVSERARNQRRLPRDEALAELVRRFFQSHGPATIRDFVWWSGLTTSDARRGLDTIRAKRFERDGLTYWDVGRTPPIHLRNRVHLLPIYDEYLVAYRDRVAVPHGPATIRSGTRVVAFRHALVVNGQVTGTWRMENGPVPSIQVTPMRTLERAEVRALDAAVERCRTFLNS